MLKILSMFLSAIFMSAPAAASYEWQAETCRNGEVVVGNFLSGGLAEFVREMVAVEEAVGVEFSDAYWQFTGDRSDRDGYASISAAQYNGNRHVQVAFESNGVDGEISVIYYTATSC